MEPFGPRTRGLMAVRGTGPIAFGGPAIAIAVVVAILVLI